MKKYLVFLLAICLFVSCEKNFIKEDVTNDTDTTTSGSDIADGTDHDNASDYIWNESDVIYIQLNETSITSSDTIVKISGSVATIKSAGTYSISGTLNDGQIIVNSDSDETIRLILNGVNITSSTSAPVYIKNGKKTIVILVDNTENYLTDATTYVYENSEETEPNAALFSNSDLTIYGNGSLIIDANYNDGISSDDGLLIKSGTVKVTSADEGLRGKDYLIVKGGNTTVVSSGDGLKSDCEDDATVGYILIESGELDITSTGDAISAQTDVTINDGVININSGGGSSKTVSSTSSAKGIKGELSVKINGGTITINTADDGIHSNSIVDIEGGSTEISAADDGIHAEKSITIANSNINITKSYEAIESLTITLDNSNVSIVATNDGFNASAGLTAGGTESNDGSNLIIKGGIIYVSVSNGDAIDSNGNLTISGGTIIGHGPSSQPELGVDCNGTFKVTGGIMAVSGPSSNMLETPGTSSTQYCVVVILTSSQSANSIFHVQDSGGNEILTFAPTRNYQTITLSSPSLKNGETYTIYTGGSYSTAATNGYYSGGTYTPGTSYKTFTISSIITTVGSSSGGNQPGRP